MKRTKIYTQDEIRKKITPILKKNNIRKAVLFGPYATNEATPESDVDLFVDSNGYLQGLKYFGANFDMEKCLHREVNLVEAHHLEIDPRPNEAEEIARTGVLIYER
jgi:predicted nucleotidyltransferase